MDLTDTLKSLLIETAKTLKGSARRLFIAAPSKSSDRVANAAPNTNLAFLVRPSAKFIVGGAEGARTPDLNTASVALSQLSYSPAWLWEATLVVEVRGLEPLTSTVRL
jgi:hypothetical protein